MTSAKQPKTAMDILAGKISDAIAAGHKPWCQHGRDPVFTGANLIRYVNDGQRYSGVFNTWLTNIIPLSHPELYEETAARLNDRALASALMTKLISFTDLTKTLKVDGSVLKGLPKLGTLYGAGNRGGWYDKKGNLFSAEVVPGKFRFKPSDDEVSKLGLKYRKPGKARFFAMYSAAQVLEYLPPELIQPLQQQVLHLDPPSRLKGAFLDRITGLSERLGVGLKISNITAEGQYAAPYNSVMMPTIDSFSKPEEWFEKAFVHVMEGAVQRWSESNRYTAEILQEAEDTPDDIPLLTNGNREPLLIEPSIRMLIAEMLKDTLFQTNGIAVSGNTLINKQTHKDFEFLMQQNPYNVFSIDKIMHAVRESVEPVLDTSLSVEAPKKRIARAPKAKAAEAPGPAVEVQEPTVEVSEPIVSASSVEVESHTPTDPVAGVAPVTPKPEEPERNAWRYDDFF